MKKNLVALIAGCLAVSFSLCGCTKSGGGDESSGGPDNRSDPRAYTTDCGVYMDGLIVNPVSLAKGTLSSLSSAGVTADILTVVPQGAAGPMSIKLHGLGPAVQGKEQAARQAYANARSKSWYFFDSGCVYSQGSVRAEVGAMVSANGESLAETMVKSGLVLASTADPCGGDKIGVCLKALEGDEPITAGPLTKLLWKPESDSDGKLAVHSGPYDVSVIVNGETGKNAGSGNGYGSLARFSKTGCGYPNPQIQVINNRSGLSYTVGGKTTFSVPNPCGRHCLQGEAMVACSK